MAVNLKKKDWGREIRKHVASWDKVGKKNGWSMKGKFVTLWVDKEGKVVDSLYSPDEATSHAIVDYDSGEIITMVKRA